MNLFSQRMVRSAGTVAAFVVLLPIFVELVFVLIFAVQGLVSPKPSLAIAIENLSHLIQSPGNTLYWAYYHGWKPAVIIGLLVAAISWLRGAVPIRLGATIGAVIGVFPFVVEFVPFANTLPGQTFPFGSIFYTEFGRFFALLLAIAWGTASAICTRLTRRLQ